MYGNPAYDEQNAFNLQADVDRLELEVETLKARIEELERENESLREEIAGEDL